MIHRHFPIWFIITIAVLVFAAGCQAPWGQKRDQSGAKPGDESKIIEGDEPAPEGIPEQTTVTLYYPDRQAQHVIPEERPVSINSGESLPNVVIRELLAGPEDPYLHAAFPKDVQLLSVELTDGTVAVDLSTEASRAGGSLLSTGSAGEMMALKSLIFSLTDLPGVESVEILIDGKTGGSVGGHVVLEEPVGRGPILAWPPFLDQDRAAWLQAKVDQGEQAWRLDPLEVARHDGRMFGFQLDDRFQIIDRRQEEGKQKASIEATRQGSSYQLTLVQPVKGNAEGIWMIEGIKEVQDSPPPSLEAPSPVRGTQSLHDSLNLGEIEWFDFVTPSGWAVGSSIVADAKLAGALANISGALHRGTVVSGFERGGEPRRFAFTAGGRRFDVEDFGTHVTLGTEVFAEKAGSTSRVGYESWHLRFQNQELRRATEELARLLPPSPVIGEPTFDILGNGKIDPTWSNFSFTVKGLGPPVFFASDPFNPATLYLGTWDHSSSDASTMILYRSTDRGDTWDEADLSRGKFVIARLVFSPVQPGLVFATDYPSGDLWRSTDGGENWQMVWGYPDPDWGPRYPFEQFAFDPANPEVAYAVMAQDLKRPLSRGIYRTLDGGRTWKETGREPGADPKVYLSSPGEPYVAGGPSGRVSLAGGLRLKDNATEFTSAPGILVSEDYGVAWKLFPMVDGGYRFLGASMGEPPTLSLLKFENGFENGASTHEEFFLRSQDGGFNWRGYRLPFELDSLAFHPDDADVLVAVGRLPHVRLQRIFTSKNGGASWTEALRLESAEIPLTTEYWVRWVRYLPANQRLYLGFDQGLLVVEMDRHGLSSLF